jgi:A/G-specific adenine glycosylase
MKKFQFAAFQESLLAWYRKNQRVLPWRAKNPLRANPYHVWLSEIMLQQTVVATVIPYFQKFTKIWPKIDDLASANDRDVMNAWAGLGYYARARNLIACAKQICHDHNKKFPDDEKTLLSLKGVGPYTAAAIRAIAFNKQAVVVDGNIERITSRVFKIQEFLPASKPIIKQRAELIYKDDQHPAEMAQALMDLGATICTPKNPKCDICPINKFCAVAFDKEAETYPLKQPKKATKKRNGYAIIYYTRAGDIWVEQRDDKRMLGGMDGFPSSDWDHKGVGHEFNEKTAQKIGHIKHVFSHFELNLDVWSKLVTKSDMKPYKNSGRFVTADDIVKLGLPSLYKKVLKVYTHAQDHT